jgi:hypothetical protein
MGMHWHWWTLVPLGVGIVVPFVFRSTRALLFDAFKHPRSESIIVRDAKGHIVSVQVENGDQTPETAQDLPVSEPASDDHTPPEHSV